MTKVMGGAGSSFAGWKMAVLLPLWVAVAFLASNYTIIALVTVMNLLGVSPENYLRPAAFDATIAAAIYSLTIAIAIGAPYIFGRRTSRQTLGLQRLPSWVDIGLSVVAFIAYALIVRAVLSLVVLTVPEFPIDQVQDVGFEALGTRADNILAFATLVVLAPIAEEVLFRGYLYGKLKNHIPAIVAAIITSLVFALAHSQLNVGVDVFVLSLVLCGLRSLTGSIWAGVLVHMIKNGLAYYLLFISPLMGI